MFLAILSKNWLLLKLKISRFKTVYFCDFSIQPLTVRQIKALKKVLDEKVAETQKTMEKLEYDRDFTRAQIGNLIHDSVVVSDNEDNNRTERTFGDIESKKKYSHVRCYFIFDSFRLLEWVLYCLHFPL